MGRHPRRNSEYYAVINGLYLNSPTIFSSWGDTHPLVTGFKNANYKGFATLDEAKKFMVENGVEECLFDVKKYTGETTPQKGQMAYYAVANGRNTGIQMYYYGSGGAEPEVVGFRGACHKHFRTLQQAEAFIADWKEKNNWIVQIKIKEKLLEANRKYVYDQKDSHPVSL